jgi:hypothetical protein
MRLRLFNKHYINSWGWAIALFFIICVSISNNLISSFEALPYRTKAACHNMPGGTLRERWLVRDVTSLIATLKYSHNVTHPTKKIVTTRVVFEARSSALFAVFSAKALLQTKFNVPVA